MICAALAAACPACAAKLPAMIDSPGRGHLRVAAGVIGVRVRVDDPADRLVARDLLDLGEQLVGKRLGHRVDDQHALVADLDRGVEPAANEHPDVALHVERVDRRMSSSALCGRAP